MILQGVYRLLSHDEVLARFGNDDGATASIRLQDWQEMGSPKQVSVTVMKLLRRTA